MKIAIVGNGEQSLLNFRASLIERLCADGHEVLAFAPDFTDSGRVSIAALGGMPRDFHLARSRLSISSLLLSIVSLFGSFRRERPDAVLCYFVKPAIYGTLAAWLNRVPRRLALIEGLGYGFAGTTESFFRRILSAAIGLLMALGLRRAHAVLVLNEDDRLELSKRTGLGHVVNVGAIGVDLARFAKAPHIEGPVRFVMACRMIAEKGIYQFVEAARKFKGDPRARFILLGGLDDNPGCVSREELESWVAEGVIEWPGQVNDIGARLACSHVFVLPSYYREGVPRSIQEAMAIGRAIITTDSVGCRDTVTDGVNGYLIPPRDADALAHAMRRFLEDPSLIKEMGQNSRLIAEERFNAAVFDAMIASRLLQGSTAAH